MKTANRVHLLIIVCFFMFKNVLSHQSCPSLATDESTHRIKDHSLVGHVILNTTASTKGLCFFMCTRECSCTSFNYQPNGHNTCELNDEDDSTHPQDVQPRPGFNYYKVHLVKNIGRHQSADCWKWCSESDPCLNGGTCDITCGSVRRIQCLCPNGFSGKVCEVKLPHSQSTANGVQSQTINLVPSQTIKSTSKSPNQAVSASHNQALTALPSRTVTASASKAVIPSPNQAFTASPSKAVTVSPSKAITVSPSKAVTPSSSKTFTPSQNQTITASPSKAVIPSPNQVFTVSLSKTVTPSPNKAITASPSKTVTASLSKAVNLSRSCLDIRARFPNADTGEYTLYDDNDTPFSTYCQFNTRSSWTLVMSYSFANNHFYSSVPLTKDEPRNFSYSDFRLSLERMRTIAKRSVNWRWTCNFVATGKIDTTDLGRTTFKTFNPLNYLGDSCKRFSYLSIRGSKCKGCSAFVRQENMMINILSDVRRCTFKAAPNGKNPEQNFGRYHPAERINKKFSCTSKSTSTTEMWFGI